MTRDGERQVIALLQSIDKSLKIISGTAPPDLIAEFPGLKVGSFTDNQLLEILVAASLPVSPETAAPVTVSPAETPLMVNTTSHLMRIQVTNDDLAQEIHVGPQNVTQTAGRVILARASAPFVLAPGATIFARCNMATVSVRVHIGYNIRDIMIQQRG